MAGSGRRIGVRTGRQQSVLSRRSYLVQPSPGPSTCCGVDGVLPATRKKSLGFHPRKGLVQRAVCSELPSAFSLRKVLGNQEPIELRHLSAVKFQAGLQNRYFNG